jgi:phage terminase large subunit-like protein
MRLKRCRSSGCPKMPFASERRDGMPYQRWADQGYLELSSGEVIDYRDIPARLEWASDVFDVQEVCFDPWNSRQISFR